MGLRSLSATGGWAELFAVFGQSCGRAEPKYPSSLPLRRSDERSTVEPFHVSWSDTAVMVAGIEGYWTLEPCRYVEPPPTTY